MEAIFVEDEIYDAFFEIFFPYFIDDATFMGDRRSTKHYGEKNIQNVQQDLSDALSVSVSRSLRSSC
jgi:hypothetical protein